MGEAPVACGVAAVGRAPRQLSPRPATRGPTFPPPSPPGYLRKDFGGKHHLGTGSGAHTPLYLHIRTSVGTHPLGTAWAHRRGTKLSPRRLRRAITSTPTITYNANGNITNTWQYQPGTTGSIVVARVMYQWPLLLGPLGLTLTNMSNGNHLMMATAVFENEPP